MAFIAFILILLPSVVQACPSCAASNNDRFLGQTMLAVAFMWLIPMALAFWVGWRIVKLNKVGKES